MSTRARAVPPVLLFAALTELGLRTLPLGVVCRGFGIRIGRERGLAPVPLVQLTPRERDVVRTVDGVYRRLALGTRAERGTCLRRALVCGALLRKHSPVLRLGCTRVEGRVHAHAWLELAGARARQIATTETGFTSLGVG